MLLRLGSFLIAVTVSRRSNIQSVRAEYSGLWLRAWSIGPVYLTVVRLRAP